MLASGFEARPAEIASHIEKRQQEVRVKTLGTLAGDLFKKLISDGSQPAEPDDAEVMSFWVRITMDTRHADTLRVQLSALVDERNQLVHEARERWDIQSKADMEAALVELDAQRERILLFRAALLPLCEGMLSLGEYARSGDFRDVLRASLLQGALVDSVRRAARADGWSPVQSVGNFFAAHRSQFSDGHRAALPNLRRLLEQSDLVDLREEAAQFGTRTVCRLREKQTSAESPDAQTRTPTS